LRVESPVRLLLRHHLANPPYAHPFPAPGVPARPRRRSAGRQSDRPGNHQDREFASLTGKEATYGQTVHKGTVFAIEEINAAGGLLGRKLELVTEDDQSKAGESATVVKKLISRDKVVAVLGELTSGRTLEAAPICQAAKIPLISPGATNVSVTTKGNYIFRVCFHR